MSAFVMSDSFFNKLSTKLEVSAFDNRNYDLRYAVEKYLGGKLAVEKVQQLADALAKVKTLNKVKVEK